MAAINTVRWYVADRRRPIVEEPNPFDEVEEPNIFDEDLEELPETFRRRRPDEWKPSLRGAPGKPPGMNQPTFLGGLMGHKPTTSLGEQVGRYYKNAGGLSKAVSSAQEAQKNRDPKVLDGLLWPKVEKGRINKQFPVDVSAESNQNADGLYDTENESVWLNKDDRNQQATLEHELSHGAYIPSVGARGKQYTASRDSSSWVRPHGDNTTGAWDWGSRSDTANYLTDPTEVDVRLAEIKRRYAHHTGNLVETPEEAQEAWDWWSAYGRNLEPQYNEGMSPYERPNESPTMSRDQFNFYDSLPPQMKQQMLHRMPELVDRGNVIRGLKGQMG